MNRWMRVVASVLLSLWLTLVVTAALAQSTGGSFGGGSFGGSSSSSRSSSSSSSSSYSGGSSSGSSSGGGVDWASRDLGERILYTIFTACLASIFPVILLNAGVDDTLKLRYPERDERWRKKMIKIAMLAVFVFCWWLTGLAFGWDIGFDMHLLTSFFPCFLVVGSGIGVVLGIRAMDKEKGTNVQCDVSGISIALDWRARAVVQRELARIAIEENSGSKDGLNRMLTRTVAVLQENKIAWLYANVHNESLGSSARAEKKFRALASELRARFKHEVVRNADGAKFVTDAPNIKARATEGQGVVVVTVLVAAHRELVDIDQVTDARAISGALDRFARLLDWQLAVMEVIWSPAVETDRMSTAELEQHYPELKKIDESSIAGRVFCGYCASPFAAELSACPHCGAPASEATSRN